MLDELRTAAIEGLYEVDRGFTMIVAHGVAAWEKVIAAREPVVRRPTVTGVLETKIRIWVEVLVDQLVARLDEQVRARCTRRDTSSRR